MSYSNDLAGDVTMETYPSGRQVTTSFDPSMRPTTMTGALGGTNTKYVQQVGYYPQGSVYYWQYGNNVWPTETYTKNLQPSIEYATVGLTNPAQYLLYLQDNWTTNGVVGSGVDCYGAAVASGSMTCISEGYGYDNLNRLTSAGETFYQNPSSGAGYSRSFHYDEYGNMSVSAYANGPASGLMPQTSHNPFNTANNRLTSATYDARGNMTLIAANSVQMAYDGESRQTQTVDPGNGQTATYLYDASGQRVQKQVGGVTTVYVHDVYGQLVATYNSAGITPVCTTCYLTYDQIGSVRLITDQNANVVGRHDYVPYGEEIFSGTGGRSGNGFGSDATVAQMFTGQERDGGTAVLDYFNARHLSAVLGSFTQPDPGNAGADITRPQSWNAYAYVLGNPLGMVDPSGLNGCTDGTADICTIAYAFGDFGGGGGGSNRTVYYPTDPSGPDRGVLKPVRQLPPIPAKNAVCAAITPPNGPINYAASANQNAKLGIFSMFKAFVGGGSQDFKGNSAFGDPDQQRAAGNFNFGASIAAKGWSLFTAQALAGSGALISNTLAKGNFAASQAAYMQGQYGGGGAPTGSMSGPDWNMGPGLPLLPSGPSQNQGDQVDWYESQSIIMGYVWYTSGCH